MLTLPRCCVPCFCRKGCAPGGKGKYVNQNIYRLYIRILSAGVQGLAAQEALKVDLVDGSTTAGPGLGMDEGGWLILLYGSWYTLTASDGSVMMHDVSKTVMHQCPIMRVISSSSTQYSRSVADLWRPGTKNHPKRLERWLPSTLIASLSNGSSRHGGRCPGRPRLSCPRVLLYCSHHIRPARALYLGLCLHSLSRFRLT